LPILRIRISASTGSLLMQHTIKLDAVIVARCNLNMRNLKIKHGGVYVVLVILTRLASDVKAGEDEFVREYFQHKAVRNVVGFSCGDVTSRCAITDYEDFSFFFFKEKVLFFLIFFLPQRISIS